MINPTNVESMLSQIRQYQDQAAQGVKLQANEVWPADPPVFPGLQTPLRERCKK